VIDWIASLWGSLFLPVGVLLVLFLPLEKAFQLRRQSIFRREWATDLAFMLGQYLLWTAPVVAALVVLKRSIASLPLATLQDTVADLPLPVQAVGVLLLSDLCIYWGHRISHQIPFLWRFHKVHHTAEHLDWLAAHREHPVDNLYTRTLENAPVFLLGFPLEVIAGFVTFRAIWGMVIHSNTALPLGPLRYVLGAPRLHHWHHAKEHPDCNYGNLMPLMDVVFGTYHDPGRPPEAYGIPEEVPRGYLDHLWRPLTPAGLSGVGAGIVPGKDFEGIQALGDT
jgi:sterol desaturase/sphingolipid hydroxylase (fatty acid hydroxylase superfamily)